MATGLFDDLIPQAPTNTAGAFSDLIPEAGLRARNPEQAALEEEQSQPTLERLGLRAALGAGGEGKGVLRVAIGNVLDYVSKNLHPGTMMLERQRGSEPVTRSIRALGQGVAELGRENIAEARELGQAVGGGKAGDVIQALGTTFTVSAPAIPAAMLGGLPAAAATAGATQFGSSMEQFRQQLIQRGETPEDAERKATLPAMLSGAITATLTRAIPGGAEMLMNRLAAGETAQGVGRFLGNILKREIPLEMAEEGWDQAGQSIVERVMVNPNKTLEETVNETVFAMGAAGLLTGLIGGVTAGTMKAAERAGDIAEDVSFNRRSRRIADVRSRLGMTPTGQTTTTERTIDATPQRPQQVSIPAQRLQTTPGGTTTEAGPGDQLQPATQEAQTPIDTSTLHVTVNAPQQIPNGPLVPGFVQIDEVVDGQNTRSGMAKVMQDAGMTVPDFSSLPQGRYTYPQALERLAALQGDRRSSPQALVEGRTPIPAVPPAIQFSGLSIPVEQLPLAERIKQKVVEENRLATGLPILNIRVVRSGPVDPAIYTVPSSGGFDTVNVDLEKLGRQLQAEGLDIEQYLALATNEEIVHNAGGAVAYDRWQSEGRQGAFPVFYNQLMQAIHDEMTPTQRTEVKNLYGVAGLDMAPVRIAEEHFRMIMQGKLKGGITEQTIGRQTLEFIKAMIKRLQEILGFERNPDRQRLIESYITQGLDIIQRTQPRAPGERFDQPIVTSNAIITPPGVEPTGAITAHHGTPHEVDRFTTAKIGTGEGAQVYGWGLYFAENPEVARAYKENVKAEQYTVNGKRTEPKTPTEREAFRYLFTNGSVDAAISNYRYNHQSSANPGFDREVLQIMESLRGKSVSVVSGNEYTVSLDVTDDQLLDWDKPLSQQSEFVRNALVSIEDEVAATRFGERFGNVSGGAIYNRLSLVPMLRGQGRTTESAKAISDYLNSIGIKGIRYLDQGSRIQDIFPTPSGRFEFGGQIFDTLAEAEKFRETRLTRNYVIFDENVIKITGKNGQPVSMQEAQDAQKAGAASPEPTPQEESPFDRMRRESGAEPPPELTPEQEAARDRNEQRRTMRPNPRFAGAANPLDRLSAEDGDDVWIETKVAGTSDYVRDRIPVTPESTTASQQHAKKIFDEAGVNVTWLEHTPPNPETGQTSKGIWRYTKEENEEGGRKLAQLLERELSGPNTDERVLLLGSLVNSIRYNDKLGNAEGVFDLPTRKALYAMSQAEASIRGALLQELNQHPAAIEDVARNVDLALHRIWHTAFGGEVIDGVMAEIRKGTQAFMTKPLINQILANNPELQNALDLVTSLSEREDALPDAATLVDLVFKSPFYKLSDFGKALEKMLINKYDVNPSNAAAIAREFQKAFDPSLKQGATEALKIATANIPYDKKAKVKGKKSIDKLVQDAINKGALESGEVLRNIAKEQGWNPPSDEEIDRMKKLSDRLTSLRNHSPEALAEYKKTNASEQEIENARQIKEAGLSSEINRVRKEMEIAWARMTKPINIWRGLPFIGNPEIRANNARAINEFIAANLLSKPGFFTRQVAAILSQWLSFVPTRSIANAIVNHQHAKNWQERQPFLKEVASQLRDGYKSQYAAMKSAIAAAQAGLLGRGEQRTVLNLTSALSALDRLTKQAEEAWAKGDYSRSILLHIMSSIKMGYRIAQGLDRLQGVPAHYQNMRAQVLRGLMDAGKTRAEAETSADLVLDTIKQEWALALVRARDLLNEAGVTPTAQAIRQNAAQIVKRKAYQKIQELGLPADDFETESSFLENTLGWNQREVKGLGGALARGMRQVERVAETWGLPLVMTRFSNAVGISINRSLSWTPLWKQANAGGPGESAWFKSEVDRAQRMVEGYVGTGLGAIALMMALTGTWVVRLRWPKDREERDLLEAQGSRPNTVEIWTDENTFIPISLNNSPLQLVAPYLAAGAALREKFDEIAKKQSAIDKQAAELGVTAQKIPGLSVADMGLVAWAAAQQAVLGGRTVSGLIGSVSQYGQVNAKKAASSYISAMLPWIPATQEMSRMAGVTLDERLATFTDYLIPLPTSGARKTNLLGDAVRTPNDLQRVMQIATGGTSLVPVNASDVKSSAAYNALFVSGFRPPSINPSQGFLVNGEIRPLTGNELVRYTQTRGERLKQALSGFVSTGDQEQDKQQARRLYQQANAEALSSVGAEPIPKYSSGSASAPSLPKTTRPRSGIRRLRSPRLRGGRIRRIRSSRSGRRIRRVRAQRLAA